MRMSSVERRNVFIHNELVPPLGLTVALAWLLGGIFMFPAWVVLPPFFGLIVWATWRMCGGAQIGGPPKC